MVWRGWVQLGRFGKGERVETRDERKEWWKKR